MPNWSASNSVWSSDNIPVKDVAFTPVLPHPITDYNTVFTALVNLQNILLQLDQSFLPTYCDEKVYAIVKEVQLHKPDQFSNLIPVLGSFHMLKVVQTCIGKYLRGSGAEKLIPEGGVFDPTEVESSVMGGKDYAKSLHGFQALNGLDTNEGVVPHFF